jgi:hypothetical protein
VDAPENARNAVIEHQKYKRFLGENPRPSYFPHKSLRAGVMEKKVLFYSWNVPFTPSLVVTNKAICQ